MDDVLVQLKDGGPPARHRLRQAPAPRSSSPSPRPAIGHLFDVVVGGDEAKRQKPAPDTLLLALRRLGARGEDVGVVVGEVGPDLDEDRADQGGDEGSTSAAGARPIARLPRSRPAPARSPPATSAAAPPSARSSSPASRTRHAHGRRGNLSNSGCRFCLNASRPLAASSLP